VLVVQQINRAYRVPLLTKLSQKPNIDLTVAYGTTPPVQAGDIGISIAAEPMSFKTISGPIGGIRVKGRYTRLLSIWPMQSIQHKRGANFILWGIGFHQHPTPLIDLIRRMMVKRTDALLLYSDKESKLYQKMGVPREKCFVTQNTVDIESIDAAVAATKQEDILMCRKKLKVKESPLLMHVGRLARNKRLDESPLLMHVGRLARNKRLDLLLKTIPNLQKKWPGIKLALIGEGPENENLKNLATELSIPDAVYFLGPITEHKRLAPWVLASDLFVAPAQIGLMAPMCMAYGKTLVISDVSEQHGPEVQVFLPGKTGLNYRFGDIEDLTRTINTILNSPKKCEHFAAAGSAHVRKEMGPEQMLDSFLAAIRYVINQ
jgi:glycosyltransferase involved in cell wall biosynthesis